MIKRTFLFLIGILFFSSVSWGQETVDNPNRWNEKIQQLSFLNRTESDYRMGTGDLVEVSLFDVENYNYKLRINSRGEVTLPLVGKVVAADLTPFELEQNLKTRFENGFINNAQVSVFVKEYRSQPVFILGAVRQPGQYQMIHQLNLVDVIAMAGGLIMEKASDYVLVQQRNLRPTNNANGAGKREVLNIDLVALLEDGNMDLNIPIQGGDVIHIPERKLAFFYVVGEVMSPGAFEIPPQNEVLVSQAIALAGGPLRTAKTKKGMLVRYQSPDSRQELAINFENIISGKAPDTVILPNDIIFMPGSNAKKLMQALLNIIPATVSGSIIWGVVRGQNW